MRSTCWQLSPRPIKAWTSTCKPLNWQNLRVRKRARNWLGSLYNNTGWSYHDLGDYASALEIFEKAETWQRSKGRVNETRIAVWSVARTLRSLNRVAEALSRQMVLKDEFETAGEVDGFVFEEIAECLLLLNRKDEARPYFAKAYEVLSQDEWLAEQESDRTNALERIGRIITNILFLRDADKNISVPYLNRISRDIHHGWQLHGFPGAHIKLAAMPRADDIIAFDIALPHWAIIVRAYISDRKELTRDVENHNGLSFDLNK